MIAWDGAYCRSAADLNDGSSSIPARAMGQGNVRYAHRDAANILFADRHVDSSRLINYRGLATPPAGPPYHASSFARGRAFYEPE